MPVKRHDKYCITELATASSVFSFHCFIYTPLLDHPVILKMFIGIKKIFSAGSEMIFVVIEDVMAETQRDQFTDLSVLVLLQVSW